MRRILRKIAEDEPSSLGDTSTLADPAVVDELVQNPPNKNCAPAYPFRPRRFVMAGHRRRRTALLPLACARPSTPSLKRPFPSPPAFSRQVLFSSHLL
jgi:hypothetical protein